MRKPEGREPIVVAVVVAIALLLILSVLAFHFTTTSQSSPGPTADGPTLYQALAQINITVRNVSGGPWTLFSVWGVAAQSPFSPNVVGYPAENLTVNLCGRQFDGLTLWNGTIPVFDGTFDSGTAPFWQVGFYSNVSHSILLTTDTLGITKIYPPMTYPGPCTAWYDLGSAPWHWTIPPGAFPADSPTATQTAWRVVGQDWLQSNRPEVELITIGPGVFNGFGDASGYGVYFDRCGQAGIAGLAEPLVLVGESLQAQWRETQKLTTDCALPSSGYGSLDGLYSLRFSAINVSSAAGTTWLIVPFQVAFAYPNGTLTSDFDGWGLANWMTSLNVTTSLGLHLPLGTATCQSWVASLAECTANVTGWYAVLLSSTGEWLDSYGATPEGTGWSVPVDALVSHQELVVVVPSSWNLSLATLNVTSTVSTSRIIGSVTL
jgi:hypothetical protein